MTNFFVNFSYGRYGIYTNGLCYFSSSSSAFEERKQEEGGRVAVDDLVDRFNPQLFPLSLSLSHYICREVIGKVFKFLPTRRFLKCVFKLKK